MKLALKDGMLYIRDPDATQGAIIKSWGKFRYDRRNHWWEGYASRETLNKLASIVRLPDTIETERIRQNTVQKLVDEERNRPAEEVKPFMEYPVTKSLYKHQVRAANMALLTFGIITPEEADDEEKSGDTGILEEHRGL